MASATVFLERPGGRIAYDVDGEGPLVVAAPGIGDLRSVYRFLTPLLVAAGYRVATMDLRGHGESDATFTEYGSVPTATDMLALVGSLDAGPAVLIGNSMSAGSAVWAAAESPALIDGLVLVGPFVRDASQGRAAELAFRVALLRPWGPRAWRGWYARLYPGVRPDDLDAHRAQIARSMAEPGRWQAFIETSRTSHAQAEARLDEVQAPTLVIMGSKDPDFSDPAAEAAFIADRLSGRVLLVPGSGHYPQAQFPGITGPAIIDFLGQRHAPAVHGNETQGA
jgi:pimeloyl-ACP methyl ester carboxylesterase